MSHRKPPKKRIFEKVHVRFRREVLDSLRDGVVPGLPIYCQGVAINVPEEIGYCLQQIVESMGHREEDCTISYYEGATEISFDIHPPEGV